MFTRDCLERFHLDLLPGSKLGGTPPNGSGLEVSEFQRKVIIALLLLLHRFFNIPARQKSPAQFSSISSNWGSPPGRCDFFPKPENRAKFQKKLRLYVF